MPREETEKTLLARASSFAACPKLDNLTAEQLRQITRAEGVDFATALLFDRVTRSDLNAVFIEQIDRLRALHTRNGLDQIDERSLIAIVPAAFYREKPHSGAGGRVIREAAQCLNLQCELVPVQSTGTLADNSRILLNWLKQHSSERIILVSLCKGGADVKFALNDPGAEILFTSVHAWVNICGTLHGSPIARWLLATKAGSFAAWLFLKTGGHDFKFLRELVPSSSSSLSRSDHVPSPMHLINVIGFPLRRHLTNGFMRRCHGILSREGPNDGGALLADVCHSPGLAYPVWGADHYLRPDDRAREIIAAILRWLLIPTSREWVHNRAEPCPVN